MTVAFRCDKRSGLSAHAPPLCPLWALASSTHRASRFHGGKHLRSVGQVGKSHLLSQLRQRRVADCVALDHFGGKA
jgi:hypothetical protein